MKYKIVYALAIVKPQVSSMSPCMPYNNTGSSLFEILMDPFQSVSLGINNKFGPLSLSYFN